MFCRTLAATALILPLASLGAAAQTAPPAIPSIGQEIDRALSQVPGGMRPQGRGGETQGQEIDRLLARPGAASPSAMRQVALAFTNKTTLNALVVQFAPTNSPDWGRNRLVNEKLNPNATMTWRVGGESCRYDVRITFDDGNELTRLDHDFCAQQTIELTTIDAQPAQPERRDTIALFRVVNRSGSTVYELSVTPSGARRPNSDLLGQWVMSEGDHYTGRVARSANCLYDVKAAFSVDGRQSATLSRQNLCENAEIVLPARNRPRS
ncbi:hypothetical protein E8L99_12720 [Phreatobacter aquaticus]|uniref:Uncharacterized protein n=1 Tax=Phreatobacter aquaticus TaxID=2570229 RepID=A0A4D7QH04_9HYPH|nr:hypothetical protein [Phreatobacter aquaticus]QCK86558.1 hypothetical protein E8L99_12720 [Phreatobacter aquaticus]